MAFHPDDRFLATAGRTVSLFSVPKLASFGNLSLDFDVSGFTSLGIASGQPAIAAGTTCGCVAVWDYKTRQQLHVDHSRHVGGTSAVQFAPLDPNVLYTTGRDGALLMQDLREGPFHVPTIRIGTGTGLTTLSIREDFSFLAAGTVDGKVLLYDPRYCAAPATMLRCGDPSPVTSLHWQHNYQSLTTRAKEAAMVAASSGDGTFLPGRISLTPADSSSSDADSPPLSHNNNINNSDRQRGMGATMYGNHNSFSPSAAGVGAAAGYPHQNPARLSLASSLASAAHLEPPRKLDVSPVVSLKTSKIPSPTGTSNLAPVKTTTTTAGATEKAAAAAAGEAGMKRGGLLVPGGGAGYEATKAAAASYLTESEALSRLRRESTAGSNPIQQRMTHQHGIGHPTEPAVPPNVVPRAVVPSAVPSTLPSPLASSPTCSSSAAISIDRTPRDPFENTTTAGTAGEAGPSRTQSFDPHGSSHYPYPQNNTSNANNRYQRTSDTGPQLPMQHSPLVVP